MALDMAVSAVTRGSTRLGIRTNMFDPDPWVHVGPPWRRAPTGDVPLVRGGRYLVSGGTGALGSLLVAHLRTRWAAEVVALGRDAPASGTFDGVFHLAGSLADPWASKRDVLLSLRATVRAPRWWLYSSISAVIPGLDAGIEGYAAANRWLESFVRETPGVTAIAWAPWAGIGMAATYAEALRARGIVPIAPENAMALLERAMAAGAPNVLVMHRGGHDGGMAGATAKGGHPAGAADRATIRATIEQALGFPVDDHTPFRTIGVDSLMALDLAQALEARLGRPLPGTLLFEAPNLDALFTLLEAPSPPHLAESNEADLLGVPLLEAQRTFVIQRRYFPDIPGNVFLALTLDPPMCHDTLADVLARVTARHMVLRSVIRGDALVPGPPPELIWGDVDEPAIRARPFDLANGPLLRVHCDGHRLVLNGHHAVLDAWSLRNVGEQLLHGVVTPGTVDWPEAAAALRARKVNLAGYVDRFSDGVPALPLGRAAMPAGPPGMLHTTLPLAPIATHAERLGVSLTALVLAAYVRRLWQWTGQHDVVVRVAQARRSRLGVEGVGRIVGSFADSVPLRIIASADLDELAPRVQAALAVSGDAPSTALAALGRLDAPTGLTPAGFSAPLLPVATGPFHASDVRAAAANGFTGLGLIAFTWEADGPRSTGQGPPGTLELSWNFLASHFDPPEVERFAAGLFVDPEPLPDQLHSRILRRCRLHPERLAAPGLTYGALDRQSAALAARLPRSHGGRVAVLARPSPTALVAVLAVLRIGAAYVPLDPDWPDARIAQVLDAARVGALITTEPGRFAGIVPDGAESNDPENNGAGPDLPGALAWVMYTSGSAGRPKGVEVSHAAALTFLGWVERMLQVTEADRFVQTSSLGFGGSIRQMYAPLLAGAMVIPAPPGVFRDPVAALAFLRTERITVFNSVPVAWVRLLDALIQVGGGLPDVRWVLLGGEAVPAAHVRRWRAHFKDGGPRLANLYGSTETVVNATWFEVTRDPEGALCPIGRAREGLQVELVGDHIVVRGAIAEGYLDGERFGGTFDTGDIGRRLPDGTLVYVGRRDSQVQVHGNRVEMGEVEAVLCQHPAVVFAALSFDGERLHATVETRADPGDLRAWLAERLPAFMVPARIDVAATLARTAAGKIDRKALPQLAADQPARSAADPPALASLGLIWKQVLRLPKLPAADDDFFALGGDSISLLDVLDAVRDAGFTAPSATSLYKARRLRDAALLLSPGPSAEGSPDLLGGTASGGLGPAASARLTRTQRGFLLAHRLDPAHPPVWTAMVPISGPLDIGRFRDALDTLVMRHDVLRTVFDPAPRVVDGRVLLQVDDLSVLAAPEAALETRWQEESSARYPLDRFPLLRARLCRVADDPHGPARHWLLLGAHHAVADAWSAWVLAGELGALHDGLALPPVEPLPAEPVPDPAWWSTYLAGVSQPAGLSGAVERVVQIPSAPFARVLRAVFEVVHELTGLDDLVVATAVAGRDSRRSRAVGPLAMGVPVRARAPFLDVASQFTDAAAHAPADAPPQQLAALARFFLSWLDPASVPMATSTLTFEWSAGRYRFATGSTGTEVMIGALVTPDGVTLHLTGGELVNPVADRLGERLGRPDAALVIYAPAGTTLPITAPTVVERVEHALGTSELILLPVTADHLEGVDLSAIPAVTQARVVALAGMLPATVGLGARRLWEARGEGGPILTTGHAATLVAVVKTIEVALARLGRPWSASTVGVLGYGSIGQGALKLAIDRLGPPLAVRVRDPRVREDPFDDVDLVIGATSGGVAMDVATLRAGTIIVDDSFPPCVDTSAARRRMMTHGDVLIAGGGMLDAGPLRRSSPYAEAAALREQHGGRWLPGCHAEAILVAADPTLGPTIGPVTLERALRMWAAVEAAGWRAAPLHLGGWVVP